MLPTRRAFLGASALAVAGFQESRKPRNGTSRLGAVLYSFVYRSQADRGKKDGISDPLVFLEHCRGLGLAGVQTSIGMRDRAYLKKLRARAEETGCYLEGTMRLPRDRSDLDRFDAEIRAAKEAGVRVIRAVLLTGRRYEVFASAQAFKDWAAAGWQSLTLAEPIVARQNVRLAIENHKDYRSEELIDVLRRLSSAHVGVTVDTGNNLALLEDPWELVKALAPWVQAIHLKDLAVREYPDGFLLSEVPLGKGFLDLKKIVDELRRARPEVCFSLEMMTRDPLKIPCFTDKYWATFGSLPGKHLARMMALVRTHAWKENLPTPSVLSRTEQLAVEEKNVLESVDYARKHLRL